MKIKEKYMRKSRFPISLFGIYLVVLLIMCGIHTGLIVLSSEYQWNKFVQINLPIIYWTLVAIGLTFFTRKKIISTYEIPMKNLANATKKVANGDFSVYVPIINTLDKLDYLDLMILDFNKMVEELGSIETMKTDFISNVSHEMKTPISIIKNYAQLLEMEGITEEKRVEYATAIDEASTRLSNLISSILKLNKLENQCIISEKEKFNVCSQLCECILQFEDQWEEKQIELDVEIEDEAYIYADANLLELVWNNIMSNAVKFTEHGGTITVRQGIENGNVWVSVSDTGCGISDENIKRIFDKFYQGDTSHSEEGNGLGLALVNRVLELLDGNIKVKSQLGKGSTFTVIFPMDENT